MTTYPIQDSEEFSRMMRGTQIARFLDVTPAEARRLLASQGVSIVMLRTRAWRVRRSDFKSWLERSERRSREQVLEQ
jgi:hypothetical protein